MLLHIPMPLDTSPPTSGRNLKHTTLEHRQHSRDPRQHATAGRTRCSPDGLSHCAPNARYRHHFLCGLSRGEPKDVPPLSAYRRNPASYEKPLFFRIRHQLVIPNPRLSRKNVVKYSQIFSSEEFMNYQDYEYRNHCGRGHLGPCRPHFFRSK